MSDKSKTGLTYPNRGARALLLGLEDLLGKHGLETILKQAGLEEWIETPLPDTLERDVDFAQLTALTQALIEFYGQRSGAGLARQANRLSYARVWGDYGELAGFRAETFLSQPLELRIQAGGTTLARVFNEISDLSLRFTREDSEFCFEFENCPYCIDVESDAPICGASIGWIEGFLTTIGAEAQLSVHESACAAAGASHCSFALLPLRVE